MGKGYEFCPYCGSRQPLENQWGLLGKEDSFSPQMNNSNSFFGGITDSIINKMLTKTIKMLEKEMQKEMQFDSGGSNMNSQNFELWINGKKVPTENVKVVKKRMPDKNPNLAQQNKVNKDFNYKQIELYNSLKKTEPKTSLRRLGKNVFYELEMNGVKNPENVAIKKLENSLEIKAISDKEAYFKIINIDLPILSVRFEPEKLIFEFSS